MRLLVLDYQNALREKKTWLSLGLVLYAVLAIPLVAHEPPPHVRDAIERFFGTTDPLAVFHYVWIDLAMNKLVTLVPVVLASGVVLTERDTGVLAILAAKPLTLGRYFLLRATTACLVMLSLHAAATVLGLLWFPLHVEGFAPLPFVFAMALHALVGVFATAFVATLAMALKRRIATALVSFSVLGLLVGMALLGFYQPAFRTYAYLNPMTLGSLSLAHLDPFEPWWLLPPALSLMMMSAITLAIGSRLALRLELAS